MKDIRTINELKDKLNLSKEDDLAQLGAYLDMLGSLSKLFREAEKDMQISAKKKQTSLGQGGLQKEIQGD